MSSKENFPIENTGNKNMVGSFYIFFHNLIPCILYSKACFLHAPVHLTLYVILYSEKKINVNKKMEKKSKNKDSQWKRKTV